MLMSCKNNLTVALVVAALLAGHSHALCTSLLLFNQSKYLLPVSHLWLREQMDRCHEAFRNHDIVHTFAPNNQPVTLFTVTACEDTLHSVEWSVRFCHLLSNSVWSGDTVAVSADTLAARSSSHQPAQKPQTSRHP